MQGRRKLHTADKMGSQAWKNFRLTILDRDGWTCQICRVRLITGRGPTSATVDHIKPRTEGGLSTPENCRALCARCNGIKSRSEAAQSALRKREAAGKAETPEPVNVFPLTPLTPTQKATAKAMDEASAAFYAEHGSCPHHGTRCGGWHSRDW